jgi:RNA polymerase sigma-70 factor (ECF subfamily)
VPPLGLKITGSNGEPVAAMEPSNLSVESLYRAHARTVARWAMRLLGPQADYEDVVHEVFLVVKRRLPEFRGEAAITTWLYEITVRVVQNARRRARRWSWLTSRGRDPDRGGLGHVLPGSWRDPLAQLEAREQTQLLYQLLDELGESQRTVLILFEIEGMSGIEIAAITGTSVSAIWVRLSRARRKFLERLQAWEAREALL